MDSFEELVKELEIKSNMKNEEILKLVNLKYAKMQNLITKEGAIQLVSKDLGINLVETPQRYLQIKNIVPGMKNVNIIGRIFKISKINEFQRRSGEKGKVANVYIADNSGHIRLPLWNDQVKLLEDGLINIGDIIKVINAMSKDNIFGDVEISIGKFGALQQIDSVVDIPSVDQLTKRFFNPLPERTDLADITPGGNFEIKGTIVYLFGGRFLFDICSVCGSKLENNKCFEHGEVLTDHTLVLSCIVDDGTDNLRVVFFRNVAEKICNMSSKELSEIDNNKRYEMLKDRLIGKEVILKGRVKKNKLFDRLELIADDVKDINPLEESKKLVDTLEFATGG